jgi:hypothetical protein
MIISVNSSPNSPGLHAYEVPLAENQAEMDEQSRHKLE